MPKSYQVGDTTYQFPDTFTDEQVQSVLTEQGVITAQPTTPATPTKDLSMPEQVSGFAKGLVGQVGRVGRGVVETAKAVSPLIQPAPIIRGPEKTGETLKGLGRGLGEMFAAPGREFFAMPQPGEPKSQALLPGWERLTAPVATALGADPAEIRRLEAEGKTGEAWAARLVMPLLTLGMGRALRLRTKLPPETERVAKLAKPTGKIPGEDVVELYKQVLPELDKTTRLPPQPRPPNLPSNQPRTTAVKPTNIPEHWGLVNSTLNRLEQEFNLELQKSAGKSLVATPVADAIRAKTHKLPVKGQSIDADAMRQVLEDRAVEFDKPWTYRDLDLERGRLYKLPKGPAAERQTAKTNADLIANKAAVDALRDIVYRQVETTSGRPEYFAQMKKNEWALMHIKDRLKTSSSDVAFATADEIAQNLGPVRKWLKDKLTFFVSPATGMPHVIVHPLKESAAGPRILTKMVKEAYRPEAISRKKVTGAMALMGRVPSREKE